MSTSPPDPAGRRLAVWAQVLYLLNLLVLPGPAFLMLAGLYWRCYAAAPPLARHHLRLTLIVSLLAGLLLILVNGLILLLGGYQAGTTWVIVVLYFTVVHSALVLLGAYGLIRALNDQPVGRCGASQTQN
ncbi:MAG: hypothetical protein R3202_15395 [Candidatus Competibacterales bacterium]|nr:hypothetical protein [Candidatus Competibacterales bacterium]